MFSVILCDSKLSLGCGQEDILGLHLGHLETDHHCVTFIDQTNTRFIFNIIISCSPQWKLDIIHSVTSVVTMQSRSFGICWHQWRYSDLNCSILSCPFQDLCYVVEAADAVLGVSLSSRQKSYCPASAVRPEPAGRELSQIVAELIEKSWRETFSCFAQL